MNIIDDIREFPAFIFRKIHTHSHYETVSLLFVLVIAASLDGSIGFVLPITEKTYRRLLMLQNALNVHLPHIAGLNPKAYRLVP